MPNTETEKSNSERQAASQLESIREMVANLSREGAARTFANEKTPEECAAILAENEIEPGEDPQETLAEAIAEETISDPAGFGWSEDEARERIQEDALSVEVRSGWTIPGRPMQPEEYMILLCTGGPACRIVGDLSEHNEPESARIEHQDWFTPWTEYRLTSEEEEDVLTYARQFYFGE